MTPSCLVVAGEKSGEEHALSFLPQLQGQLPGLELFGVGGDALRARGMDVIFHTSEFSSFGFSEVIGKLPFYFKAADRLLAEVKRRGTKVAILIDFQDFNLRLAQKLARQGVSVLYYVAPQAWVWRDSRTKALAKSVHTLFCILPFEENWFKQRGVKQTVAAPHPVVQEFKHGPDAGFHRPARTDTNELKLLLLPGSRKSEVLYMLPSFLEAVKLLGKQFQGSIQLGIVQTDSVPERCYAELDWFEQSGQYTIRRWKAPQLAEALKWADLALSSSGTVVLSCALYELPTVVAYKASLFNQWLFSFLVSYPGPYSLPNIMMGKVLFPEYLQDRCEAGLLKDQLYKWANDRGSYQSVLDGLHSFKHLVLTPSTEGVVSRMGQVLKGAYENR